MNLKNSLKKDQSGNEGFSAAGWEKSPRLILCMGLSKQASGQGLVYLSACEAAEM